MNITKHEKEWIEATQHEAFADRVIAIREEMLKSLDDKILKLVGLEHSLRSDDEQTNLENQLNEVIARELFRALHPDQLAALLNSHKIDR